MLVPWRSLHRSHKSTSQFKKGAERKRKYLPAEEAREATLRAFSTYRRTLKMVLSLKYLGRVLLAAYYDWPLVIQNLTKVWAVWRRISRILIREGVRLQVYRFFFKAVAQSVLLFGAETWVVASHTGRVLGGFQD